MSQNPSKCSKALKFKSDSIQGANTQNGDPISNIISSEGALYVILPYDYPAAQRHPLFEHTPVLNDNFEY